MKWDLDSHTSSRSLTHPAGNLNNKPAARNDHTAQPETEPALNRFALKPLALSCFGRQLILGVAAQNGLAANHQNVRIFVHAAPKAMKAAHV